MINTKKIVNSLTEISLSKDKMWSIEGDRRGDVISCTNGTLWVTQEGDPRDYILEQGRNFWVTRSGTVIVQALNDSKFKFSLNEMENHIEINSQPIQHSSHSA